MHLLRMISATRNIEFTKLFRTISYQNSRNVNLNNIYNYQGIVKTFTFNKVSDMQRPFRDCSCHLKMIVQYALMRISI